MAFSLLAVIAILIAHSSTYMAVGNLNNHVLTNHQHGVFELRRNRRHTLENDHPWSRSNDVINTETLMAYLPWSVLMADKRRYRPSTINQDGNIKRSAYGLWKPRLERRMV